MFVCVMCVYVCLNVILYMHGFICTCVCDIISMFTGSSQQAHYFRPNHFSRGQLQVGEGLMSYF